MAEALRNCVDDAIKLANGPEHNGEGFYLRLVLVTGRIVEGPTYANEPGDPVQHMQILNTDGRPHDPEDAFIYKQNVAMASVVWF